MTSDLAMRKLFYSDLKEQTLQILDQINHLQTQFDEKQLDALIKYAQDITSAAMLVRQPSIAELFNQISHYLLKIQKEKLKLEKSDFDRLLAASALVEKVAEQEEEESFSEALLQTAALFKTPEIKITKENIIDESMVELFQTELESQTNLLNDGLVRLEQNDFDRSELESLMRAAHSIKGAARVVNLDVAVTLAHAMEDCFSALLKRDLTLEERDDDCLFQAVDLLTKIARMKGNLIRSWIDQERPLFDDAIRAIHKLLKKESSMAPSPSVPLPAVEKVLERVIQPGKESDSGRILRVTARNLNRLMGLAGESMVESRWLHPFSESLVKLKKSQNDLSNLVDQLRESFDQKQLSELSEISLSNVQHKMNECRQNLSDRLTELELFISRHSSLTDRLYTEVIDSRMRPFADGVSGFPRMVRDIAKELGKKVHLVILGKSTPVDRDILEKLETPLSHLLRNSIDHGIETPDVRIAHCKPPEGTITIEARHRAGMLVITVSDDGCGIDIEELRRTIVDKKLAKKNFAEKLTATELLDFLFLPGFSTARSVSEISGRGMGLNIVQNMVQEVVGSVRIESNFGKGTTFLLHLPLTLSVIRAMIAQISGEVYAFPLARIDQAVIVPQSDIQQIENRQYFNFEGQNIGLAQAAQVLGLKEKIPNTRNFPVIILNDRTNSYGVVVDCFLGERELVVQEMDHRLGKIPNILSGAFMEDGSPVLIIDVEDMVRSIDNLLSGGRLHSVQYAEGTSAAAKAKSILVVDDSITVREVQCRLLRNKGYEVETAVNGMDAWNAVRLGKYDLVITDIDMPRMNGIELVKAIRNDSRLKSVPIMIISYKERENDRLAGLEAGANYYLTKSSFHDETLLDVVNDLIGKP